MKYKVVACGITKSVIFGLGFLITAKSMERLGIFDLLSLRFLIAALTFEILRITVFRFRLNLKDIIALIPVGLLMPIGYYTFEAIGLKGASSMAAGIIISFVPALTFIFEIIFAKEKADLKKALYILISVGGVVLITVFSGSGGKDTLSGIIFLLFAAFSEAFYTIVSKKKSLNYTSAQRTYIMMWVGAIIFNGINIIKRTGAEELSSYFSPLFDLSSLALLLYMGIVPLVIAFFLYNYMLEKDKSSNVSIYTGLETVVAIFAGIVFNNESLNWYHIIGTIMIFMGVWRVNKDETHSKNT